MLTPVFHLDQNDRFLIVTIRAPHCKLADAEISYDGNMFLFHASPYFLRLFLTGEVVDDETGICNYDSDEGRFTVYVPKKCRAEHFPRLEMLSELIKPQQHSAVPNAGRLIEVVGTGKENGRADKNVEDDGEGGEEGIDGGDGSLNDELLYAQQRLNQGRASASGNSASQFGYGFGWLREGVLEEFGEEIAGLIDLDDLKNVPIDERMSKLREFDEKHFREQHYLADLFAPEQLQLDAMEFMLDPEQHLKIDEQDRTELKDLKIRQLEKFPPEVAQQIALSLVDILFGFHYDLRTTMAEHNVESGWTISKLAPSLTSLIRWPNMREAIVATVRHSLVLPLIRNWDLSVKVLRDVFATIKAGRPSILHCLLVCRRIFNGSGEFRYLLNQLFLDDLCLWIQSVPDEALLKLKEDFKREMKGVKKEDMLELDLEFIEVEARLEMMKPMDSDDEEAEK